MKVDLDHVNHWMRAVRESKDPSRTIDAFWIGQLQSKEWVVDELTKLQNYFKVNPTVDIHGGWVGTLASLLFQSNLNPSFIKSVDIDPDCRDTARTMNKIELIAGKFKAVTEDMCTFNSYADIVINTSFEHITQDQYDLWLERLQDTSLIVLQSNNFSIPEHVRIAQDIEEFKDQSQLKTILYQGELDLSLYKRFMIIGKK